MADIKPPPISSISSVIRCPPVIFAQSRIPKVRGRIKLLKISMTLIKGAPKIGKSEGVIWERKLIISTDTQRIIVAAQTLNLSKITKTGQQVKGTQELVKPKALKINK